MKTEQIQLDSEITLQDRSGAPLIVKAIALSLTHQADQVTDCHLTIQVLPETYQYIDTHALFRLLPRVRGYFAEQAFQPDLDIEIKTKLCPSLLTHLGKCSAPDEAIDHLVNLNQHKSHSPLLSTESWMGLHVKQTQSTSDVGYRTFWAYASSGAIAQETISSGQIFEEMETFFNQEWAEALPDDIVEAAMSDFLEELGQAIEAWVDESFSVFSDAVTTELVEELTQNLEGWATHELLESSQNRPSPQPIFQAVLNFFQEDDWSFTKIRGQTTLRLAFQGKHGRWTCYAKAKEEQQQFVFYSLCPIATPEDKRQAIAEFLTRANYGMTIGNFEIDLDDGEIRYKTSIDVKGDRLTPALIKQLVYTNVLTMDQYLPGIQAVLAETIPAEAIAAIEQTSPNAPISSVRSPLL